MMHWDSRIEGQEEAVVMRVVAWLTFETLFERGGGGETSEVLLVLKIIFKVAEK